MRALWLLLIRAVIPARGNILSFALWVSMAGVALGITLVTVVLAVMTGFQSMLEDNFTRISSTMVIIPDYKQPARRDFRQSLLAVDGVQAVTPFRFSQGMVFKQGAGATHRGGVTLEGVEMSSTDEVTDWKRVWQSPPIEPKPGQAWIWLGSQLANKLQIQQGDTVNVLFASGDGKKVLPFTVTAITKFGIYEHDLRYAMVDIEFLESVLGTASLEPKYKTRLAPNADRFAVEKAVESLRDGMVEVRHWYELNQNLFMAVEHQKRILFLMLQIIIALAAVNITNLLLMTTNHRKRDIAILRAMGLQFRQVIAFFVVQGTLVGGMGVFMGIGTALGVCALAEKFQPALLNEKVYNVSYLPFEVRFGDISIVCLVAFLICVIFSVVPAIKAALEKPVQTLRYES